MMYFIDVGYIFLFHVIKHVHAPCIREVMRIMEFTGLRNSHCSNHKCTYKVASADLAWRSDQHMTLKIQIMSGGTCR